MLSGIAMAAAGSSRPCSGGDHEILHAIDLLYPGAATHGDLAGLGGLFCAYLREDKEQYALIDHCLRQHGLPRAPGDIGLTVDQFAQAVIKAPSTRPDRYTILEHLGLDDAEIGRRAADYTELVSGSS